MINKLNEKITIEKEFECDLPLINEKILSCSPLTYDNLSGIKVDVSFNSNIVSSSLVPMVEDKVPRHFSIRISNGVLHLEVFGVTDIESIRIVGEYTTIETKIVNDSKYGLLIN